MATETIAYNGRSILTLKELLRPGLKAVFVGLNPANTSVEKGHYYQGHHGRIFWGRLRRFGLTPALPHGAEDDAAFELGYGFADLVRRPTASSKDLSCEEKLQAVSGLGERLSSTGDYPLIVFVYVDAMNLARPHLVGLGYKAFKMPGPYERKEDVQQKMLELKKILTNKKKRVNN